MITLSSMMDITRIHHSLAHGYVELCPQAQSNQAKTTCGSGKMEKTSWGNFWDVNCLRCTFQIQI